MVAIATVLVACSSSGQKGKTTSYDAEKAKFGAKYNGRHFMPYGTHFQAGRLGLNAAPVNQLDFYSSFLMSEPIVAWQILMLSLTEKSVVGSHRAVILMI